VPTALNAKPRKALLREVPAMQSTLTSKGQMTLPKEARDHLGLKPGDKVRFFKNLEGQIVILPVLPLAALRGMLKSNRATPASMEELENGIAEGAVERYRQFLDQ
jgi:antitoxin PrlF